MAVSLANLTSGTDTDGNSTATTASVSPSSNKLELLTVSSRTLITANPNQPTISGNGLTWVAIASVVYDDTSSSRRRITLFRALGASPSSGAISIDFGGQNQTTVVWSLEEVSGIDTSGTNGSGAIVQSATNFDDTATASTLTVTLGAFSNTNNATFGSFANGFGLATPTVGSGFTKLGEQADGNNDIKVLTEWKSTNDTTVDINWGDTSELGGIAIEIRANAIQRVQKKSLGWVDTASITLDAPATAGNLLIACHFTRATASDPPSGWSEAVLVNNATESDQLAIYYKVAAGGEQELTFVGNNDTNALTVFEYSGMATTTPLDVVASTGRTTGAVSLTSGTTAETGQADELVIVCIGLRIPAQIYATDPSWSNSFTQESNINSTQATNNTQLFTGSHVEVATGTKESTCSWTTSATVMGAIATFKAAVTALGPGFPSWRTLTGAGI